MLHCKGAYTYGYVPLSARPNVEGTDPFLDSGVTTYIKLAALPPHPRIADCEVLLAIEVMYGTETGVS